MSSVNGSIGLTVKLGEIISSGVKQGRIDHGFDLSLLQMLNIASGTGAGMMDKVYSEKDAAIGTSTTVDRDFSGSVLDSEGATIAFAKVKLLMIYNGGTTPITVKGKTANILALFTGSTDKITIAAGACFFFFDPVGIAVTNATADSLTLGNASASIAAAFTMIVGGTSA